MIKNRILKGSLFLPALFILASIAGCQGELAGVLNPKGIIAFEERQLLFDASALMLIVVIPVIVMSIAFVWRYHQSKGSSEYLPNWSHSNMLESIWWGVPIAIILVLALMTWTTTHKLDPFKKIDNIAGKTLPVQVVALPWKWLFIYPEQKIATVNLLELPRGRQVEFFLTTDNVPMSAFFVPQLGSQIYTMAGMRTRLYLVATHLGVFKGLNTQYNGDGFSDMHFDTHVVTDAEFDQWTKKIKKSPLSLSMDAYRTLRQPTVANPEQAFSGIAPDLFKTIIQSYRSPTHPSY